MIVIGIDPGSSASAYVAWDGSRIKEFDKIKNEAFVERLDEFRAQQFHCAIEQIRGYGLRVGNETFDTCFWSGRFYERFGPNRSALIQRKDVGLHLCGSNQPGDKFIRAALIDRFGGPAAIRKGGPLCGVSGDVWSALAVALTYWDTRNGAK